MGAVHAHEANFHVIQGCPRPYDNFHSYRKHMYLRHREFLELSIAPPVPEVQPFEPTETADLGISNSDTTMQPSATPRDEKRHSALFLLKATTVSKVSETALDNLVGDISILLDSRMQSLQEDISTALHHRGIEFDSELAAIFQNPSITVPFQGLSSQFLRKKFYREEMGFGVSVCLYT